MNVARIGVCCASLLVVGARAEAQWYLTTLTGTNATRSSTVTLDQPGIGRHLDFQGVTFEARPMQSPQYYGLRIGRHLSPRFGVEVEFLHIKVFALTDRTVRVTGVNAAGTVDVEMPMNQIVQRHNTTHGLNYWMANLAWRRPLRAPDAARPVTLILRAGAGPVMPGVDVVIDHTSVQGYQFSGFGGQLSAGLDVRVRRWLSITAEYKFTRTRPELEISGGTTRMTALSHHLAAGFALGFNGK